MIFLSQFPFLHAPSSVSFLSSPFLPTSTFFYFYNFLLLTVATESLLHSRPCAKDLGYRDEMDSVFKLLTLQSSTSALPRSLSEMHILGSHLTCTGSETLGVGPSDFCFNKPSKGFWSPSLRTPALVNSTSFSSGLSEDLNSIYNVIGHLNQSLHLAQKNKYLRDCQIWQDIYIFSFLKTTISRLRQLSYVNIYWEWVFEAVAKSRWQDKEALN